MRRLLSTFAISLSLLSLAQSLPAQTNPVTEFTQSGAHLSGFGYSLAASGYYVYIGAPNQSSVGAVYMYENSAISGGTGWTQVAEITSPDKPVNNYGSFGVSLAAYESELIVGDHQADSGAGAVYVYGRQGNTLKLLRKLYEPSPGINHHFGISVAVAGSWMVVGSLGTPVSGTCGATTGAAYLYQNTGQGWNLVQQITENCDSNSQFGAAVSMIGPTIPGSGATGAEIAIGDPLALNGVGKAYVYQVTNTATGYSFASFASVVPPDTTARAWFGTALSLDSGGNLAVGAPAAYNFQGRSYIFKQEEPAPGSYDLTFVQELRDNAAPFSQQSTFGESLAFTTTDKLAIGAPGENNNAGQVLTYEPNSDQTTWAPVETFNQCSNYGQLSDLGSAVAAYGADILVGSGSYESSTGIAFLFATNTPAPCR